jgi:hypothetical protein
MLVSKSIFQSVTFWGAVTSLIAMLAPELFVKLGYDPQTVAADIVAGIGFIVTLYGRFTAKQLVTLGGGVVIPPALPPGAAPLSNSASPPAPMKFGK